MAFPTTSVLKTFTLTNGLLTTRDSDFTTLGGATEPDVVSNAVTTGTSSYVGAFIDTPATYGPDQEVFMQSAVVPDYFGVLLGTTLSGSYNGYKAGWSNAGSNNLSLEKVTGGSGATIGTPVTLSQAAGAYLGLERVINGGNADLKVYTSPDGSSWTLRISHTDSSSPFTAAAGIGFDLFDPAATSRLDNMGGGTIAGGTDYTGNVPGAAAGSASGPTPAVNARPYVNISVS